MQLTKNWKSHRRGGVRRRTMAIKDSEQVCEGNVKTYPTKSHSLYPPGRPSDLDHSSILVLKVILNQRGILVRTILDARECEEK